MTTRTNSNSSLQNILEDTIQQLFSNTDLSLNFTTQEESLPDLIPIQNENENQNDNENDRAIRLWSNVLDDYHTQMRLYQENVRTILQITQNFLPGRYTGINNTTRNTNIPRDTNIFGNTNTTGNPNTASNTNIFGNTTTFGNTTAYWRNLLNAIPTTTEYIFEIERLIPPTPTTRLPTIGQIQAATEIFEYDPENDPIAHHTCPISLEDFREGESLTRIISCGHIFKTNELSRWFTRNSHCPSCRYDIRTQENVSNL
jgi:hypothetical protein